MRPGLKYFIQTVAIILACIGLLVAFALWQFHRQHPYGWSHCCDLCLYWALDEYATKHGGAFPAGEATPEASLSVLYREKREDGWRMADANLLRGKTVPEATVKQVLERGELLTPETCGWHYVEGLRMDDDPRLALFWDKIGLDHNGGTIPEGGHIVMFVDGIPKHIPETEWATFLDGQRKLLTETRTAIRRGATIRIDNCEVRVQVRAVDHCIYGSTLDSSRLIATTQKQKVGTQGLPVIPIDEIKDAKVVVENARVRGAQRSPDPRVVQHGNPRVRFLLKGREIVYDRSGFHIEATPHAKE